MAVLVGRAKKARWARAVMPRGDWGGSPRAFGASPARRSLVCQNRHATKDTHLRNFAAKEAGGSYTAQIDPITPPSQSKFRVQTPTSIRKIK